jgi:outer membrane protein
MTRVLFATAILCSVCVRVIVAGDVTPYEPPKDAFFPTPTYFHNHFGAPPSRVQLEGPIGLAQYVRDGKVVLSLRDYLNLVMANNSDITVQRVEVQLYENAITRAFSIFDPFANATFLDTRSKTPSNSALNGAATLNQLTQPLNLSFQQLTPTGGSYAIGFNDTKLSTNSSFATYNPSYTQNLNFSFNQPLLRGFGPYITKLPITIARSRLRQGSFTLQDQVTQLVAGAESSYWDVVEAREALRVQEESLRLSEAALKRTQREIELGATSALDVFQPQQQYTTAQLSVEQARFRLIQTENVIRRQTGMDLDANMRLMPLELTESPAIVTAELNFDPNDTISRAMSTRFDLQGLRQGVSTDDLLVAQAKNQMKPALSLVLNYGTYGQGGNFFERQGLLDSNGNPSTLSVLPGGPLDALNQLFGFGFPTYSIGLNLSLPIRDRNATANLADALVSRKADLYRVRSTEEAVRQQVLNALTSIEQSKQSIALAQKVQDLARQRVDAEQKKYDLGTTTIFFVLAAQTDLTLAESTLVRESINLRRNLLSLYQSTGDLLNQRSIRLTIPQ